jgi:hypothetical protein
MQRELTEEMFSSKQRTEKLGDAEEEEEDFEGAFGCSFL